MPPDGRRLEHPRPNAVVKGDVLAVRGAFDASRSEPVAITVWVAGEERARAAPRRDGSGWRYEVPLDLAGLPCRIPLMIAAEDASGARETLHDLTVWRTAFAPDRPRIAVLTIEAVFEGGHIAGRASGDEPLGRVDVWTRGVRIEAPVDAEGRFAAWVPPGGVAHLHGVYRDGSRPDVHLGRLPERRARDDAQVAIATLEAAAPADRVWRQAYVNGRPAEVSLETTEDGRPARAIVEGRYAAGADTFDIDFNGLEDGARVYGRLTPFRPLEAFRAASAAGAKLRLTYRDGRTEQAVAVRLVAAGDDWTLVLRDDAGFRDVLLCELAGVEATTEPAGPDPADPPPSGLKAHGRGLSKPRLTMRSDELPFGSVVLPAIAPRPPPREIRKVVLIRPGAYPTDELYVLAPLGPLLEELGAPLRIVTIGDGTEAGRRLQLGPRTVVIVSRAADAAWLYRLTADQRPFVVYLMDDDPPTAVDSPGLQHRYRRRTIEILQDDFRTLLRRCDRFLTTSPRLALRYASVKTVLIEPPFIRPPASMAHLDDLSMLKVAYHATDVHHEDIAFLYPALARALRRNEAIRFQLISGLPAPKALAKLPNFEMVRPMNWPDYKAFAAANPAHVSLAPMLDTPFNAAKSTIKAFDAASLGAVGLYSAIPPYAGFVEDGVDGFLLENDPPAWGRMLETLARSPKRLRRTARACQRTARTKGALDHATAVWRALLGLE